MKNIKKDTLIEGDCNKNVNIVFFSPMMSLHAEKSSVEDRLKRNRYNVLRTNADMDKGLGKR